MQTTRYKATAYDIVIHGIEHSQYFQGCDTTFTKFDICFTGIGDNAKEAYNDAVEQAYCADIDSKSLDRLLPKRPHGIRVSDKVPYSITSQEECEVYYYVSIRLKLAKL